MAVGSKRIQDRAHRLQHATQRQWQHRAGAVILPAGDFFLRDMHGHADMGAHIGNDLFRLLPQRFVQDHMNLVASVMLQVTAKMRAIEAPGQKAGFFRIGALQIFAGIAADPAAAEQHAIVRIGALNRIAQLNDQPCIGQHCGHARRCQGVGKIVRGFFPYNAPRWSSVKEGSIPGRPAIKFRAEIMRFRAGEP